MAKFATILFLLLSCTTATGNPYHGNWQGTFEMTTRPGLDALSIKRALAQYLSITEENLICAIKPKSSLRRLQNDTTSEVRVSGNGTRAQEIVNRMEALNEDGSKEAEEFSEHLANEGIEHIGGFNSSAQLTTEEVFTRDGEVLNPPVPAQEVTPTPAPTPVPAPPPAPVAQEENDNTGAIVGGIVGGVVGLGLIGGIGYFLLSRKRIAEA